LHFETQHPQGVVVVVPQDSEPLLWGKFMGAVLQDIFPSERFTTACIVTIGGVDEGRCVAFLQGMFNMCSRQVWCTEAVN